MKEAREPGKQHNGLLKQAVIGLGDGVIITLAVCTGLSVLLPGNEQVLPIGFIALAAGALIMGMGGYFAAAYKQEGLAAVTDAEEQNRQQAELHKTVQLFKKLDIGEDMQQQAATEIKKDSAEWRAYLHQYQQQPEAPDKSTLPKTAIIIALAYALAGLVPLLPYYFTAHQHNAFIISISSSMAALLLFGLLRGKVNGEPMLLSALRLLMLGALATGAAWAVAGVFLS